MKFMTILLGILVAVFVSVARAQDCGAPPGPYTYSTQFYKAQARLLQADRGNSTDVSVKYDDLAVNGSQKSSEKISDYEKLTIAEATQIVQQEHASAAANIIAECGYRACFLQNARSGPTLSTLTLLSQVCNPALAVPSTNSISSGNQLSVSPGNATIVFSSSAPQQRTIQVRNGTAGTMDVTWTIDPGQNSQAQGVISVIQPTAKSFSIGPNASAPVKITIHKVQGDETVTPTIKFSAVTDSTVSATTQLIVVPNPLLLLPPAEIPSGTLNPNATIIVEQRNANVPTFYASHDKPETFPVPSTDVQYSNPSPGWGTEAHARYQATFQKTASQPDRVAAEMKMSAYVGGTCGGAFTEAPGAYGEVTPDWSSSLNLPGFKGKQMWQVTVATDIGPFATSGSCKVAIGVNQTPIATSGPSKLHFKLDPGAYALELTCSDPNSPKSFGCKGAPGLANYKNQKYEIRIEANRSAVGPKPVAGTATR